MSTFRPPPDESRCRAIVLYGGQRARCRWPRRAYGTDLCLPCWLKERREGKPLPRVPVAKEGA